jgi:hypothetical protein
MTRPLGHVLGDFADAAWLRGICPGGAARRERPRVGGGA